jgi:hypothetical protein
VSILDWVGLVGAAGGLIALIAIPIYSAWQERRYYGPFKPDRQPPYRD